jgi:hypothetical protein
MIRNARGALLALLCAAAVQPAIAHRAPNSVLKLDFRAESVGAELLVPVSELAYATGATPSADALAAYLLRHVGAETAAGARWTVVVTSVRATTYFEHDYFLAELTLVPPRGASARQFVLVNDVITHEVRNHVVFVVSGTNMLGALQFPASRLFIRSPLSAQHRHPGSSPAG